MSYNPVASPVHMSLFNLSDKIGTYLLTAKSLSFKEPAEPNRSYLGIPLGPAG